MSFVIETKNLTKKFKKTIAVNQLNLQVPEGSIFAYLGPNGAGKTTTIKLLMNILYPDEGSSWVFGKNSMILSPREFSQIGYVSENQDIPEWMTVEYFLGYCQKMYASWDASFCQRLISQFNLPLKQKIKSLSRGMKMKAALISALAYKPKLLVLDEPFSGLDPLVRDEFISGVLDVTESQSWTIFISSHDIDEVERLADWVGIIDQGSLKLVEEVEQLQDRFRKVELTLAAGDQGFTTDRPEQWILFKQQDRAVQFYDTDYHPDSSEQRIREYFPDCTNINLGEMSLKEIFIAFARTYRGPAQ